MTTVVHNNWIFAHFQVSERDYLESAAEWSEGRQSRQIRLTLADQSEFPHASESCQALAGSYRDGDIHFSAKFPNPDGLLRGGRSGTVSVSREWKAAIFLPRQATFRDHDRQYVFVVDESHVAHRRAIVIGDGTEDSVVVKKGSEWATGSLWTGSGIFATVTRWINRIWSVNIRGIAKKISTP